MLNWNFLKSVDHDAVRVPTLCTRGIPQLSAEGTDGQMGGPMDRWTDTRRFFHSDAQCYQQTFDWDEEGRYNIHFTDKRLPQCPKQLLDVGVIINTNFNKNSLITFFDRWYKNLRLLLVPALQVWDVYRVCVVLPSVWFQSPSSFIESKQRWASNTIQVHRGLLFDVCLL